MGKIIVLSGFSGSGKGTLVNELLKRRNDFEVVRSCTTRKPRFENEFYTFLSEDEFNQLEKAGGLLEFNSYNGNKYGTPVREVERILGENKSVLLEIDVNGKKQVYASPAFGPDDRHSVFIVLDGRTLYERLKGRGTENNREIIGRLETALRESEHTDSYECILFNNDLEETVNNLEKYIDGNTSCNQKKDFNVEQFRCEIKEIIKKLREEGTENGEA